MAREYKQSGVDLEKSDLIKDKLINKLDLVSREEFEILKKLVLRIEIFLKM